jgi:hypothetical protein
VAPQRVGCEGGRAAALLTCRVPQGRRAQCSGVGWGLATGWYCPSPTLNQSWSSARRNPCPTNFTPQAKPSALCSKQSGSLCAGDGASDDLARLTFAASSSRFDARSTADTGGTALVRGAEAVARAVAARAVAARAAAVRAVAAWAAAVRAGAARAPS